METEKQQGEFLKDFGGRFQLQLPNKIILCIVNICKLVRIICVIMNYMSFFMLWTVLASWK